MRRKYFYISLFIISIIGLSIVQYQYFRIGLNLAGRQFNENMGEAITSIKEGLGKRNELTYLMGTVLTDEESNFSLGLDSLQDATVYFLNDYLKSELLEQGVKAKFSYELRTRDSAVFLKSDLQFEEGEDLLFYPIGLQGYLVNQTQKDLILEIRFKNLNRYFLSQLNGLTIPSIVFMGIIIFILIWVFRAFYLQKNLITHTNEYINNLTHELKTPVFSLGIATKILEEKVIGDGAEVVAMMRSQLEKLKMQIDKVLELAIIEGKKNVIEKNVFDLTPVLKEVGSDFGSLVALEGGEFRMDLTGEELRVKGDQYHLQNSVNSLLENARKYSGDNLNVVLLAYREGKDIIIKVVDQGIGISEDSQKKIFDKYYRVPKGDRHDVKGYGLGLHYVKRIVTLHKGKIKVESQIGEGSTFTIGLPAA